MAHAIKGAGGTCCDCEQRISCDECGGVCPGIQSRSRGGIAQLIGYGELTTPSSPPRLYRRSATSGAQNFKQYDPSDCSGAIIKELDEVYDGVCQIDRLTGVLTTTGGACNAPIRAPGCELSTTLTRTRYSQLLLGACCPDPAAPGKYRVATGGLSWTLSDEDKDEDAVARLLLSPGGQWTGWSGELLPSARPAAFWQPREGDATAFAYQEIEVRVSGAPGTFEPGEAMTAVVAVWRARWGSSDFVFDYTEEVGFIADPDGSAKERKIVIVPTKGFVDQVRGCYTRPGLPV